MYSRSAFHNRSNQDGNITSVAVGHGKLTGCNSASAREAMEIVLRGVNVEEMVPGPFVVIQGTPGDGMANTIDSMPMIMEIVPQHDEIDAAKGEGRRNGEDGSSGSLSISIPSDLPNEIPNLSIASAQSSHTSSMESNVNVDPIIEVGSNHGSDGELIVVMADSMTSDASSTELAIGEDLKPSATESGIGTPRVSNVEANSCFQSRTQIDRGLHLPLPASAVNVRAMGLGYNSFMPPLVTSDGSEVKQPGRNLLSKDAASIPKGRDDKINAALSDSFIFVDEKEEDTKKETQSKESHNKLAYKPSQPEASSPNIDIGMLTSRENNPHYTNISLMDETAIQQWKKSCREEEILKRSTMFENISTNESSQGYDYYFRHRNWWTTENGCLAVFESLPVLSEGKRRAEVSPSKPDPEYEYIFSTDLGNQIKIGPVCAEIPPGTTVLATEIHYIDESLFLSSEELNQSGDKHISKYHLLKIESPIIGFVVYSANGFCYLGAGLPTSYIEPEVWLWRVMCPTGSFIRYVTQYSLLTSNFLC